jgi:hypothetical protein
MRASRNTRRWTMSALLLSIASSLITEKLDLFYRWLCASFSALCSSRKYTRNLAHVFICVAGLSRLRFKPTKSLMTVRLCLLLNMLLKNTSRVSLMSLCAVCSCKKKENEQLMWLCSPPPLNIHRKPRAFRYMTVQLSLCSLFSKYISSLLYVFLWILSPSNITK